MQQPGHKPSDNMLTAERECRKYDQVPQWRIVNAESDAAKCMHEDDDKRWHGHDYIRSDDFDVLSALLLVYPVDIVYFIVFVFYTKFEFKSYTN